MAASCHCDARGDGGSDRCAARRRRGPSGAPRALYRGGGPRVTQVVATDLTKISNGLRQEQELRALESGNVSHAGFYCAAGGNGIRRRNFSRAFTQSGPLLHTN